MDDAKRTKKLLEWELRHADPNLPKRNKIRFTTLPLNTELTWQGIRLADVMVPRLDMGPANLMILFDAWVEPVSAGQSRLQNLKEAEENFTSESLVADTIANFAARSDADQLELLLHIFSKAGGVRREGNMIIAGDVTFGVREDFSVVSRFNTGVKFRADRMRKPSDIMTRTFDMYVRRPLLVGWTHAVVTRDEELLNAIKAMVMAGAKFDSIGGVAKMRRRMDPAEVHALEKIIQRVQDPLSQVYNALVPAYTDKRGFEFTFGPLKNRKRNPRLVGRRNMITKLNVMMWKQTEEFKKRQFGEEA